MRDSIDDVLRLSYDAQGVAGGDARAMIVAETLQRLIPSDMVGYAELGETEQTARMMTPAAERERVAEAAGRSAHRHPIALALRSGIRPGAGIRISDVIEARDWRRHEVYQGLFKPLGFVHELVLPLPPTRERVIRAWSWSRPATRDFGDGSVVLATLLAPLLTVIQIDDPEPSAAARDLIERAGLTAREAEVLRLLPSGMTAQQMAVVLRISTLTVRKHLEHVYDKLGVHDRTRAVMLVTRAAAGG